jgi:hypothetical protein
LGNLRTVHLSARTVALDAPCTQGSTVSLRPYQIIPTLFKNRKKCEILYERVRKA